MEKKVEERKLVGMSLELPRDSLLPFRRLLFKNNLSFQEFITFLIHMAEFNAPYIQELMDKAKKTKMEGAGSRLTITNSNDLYNIIESKSPFKEKEETDDNFE